MSTVTQRTRGVSTTPSPAAAGLRLVAVGLGIFFIAMSMNKIAWLTDPNLLLDRFVRWAPTASPSVRWYLQMIAIPAAPALARLIPIGEFCTGLAFVLGIWIRPAAMLALFLVVNFHFGTSAFYAWEFLRDGTGPPVLAGLLALAVGAKGLPFTVAGLRQDTPLTRAAALVLVCACASCATTVVASPDDGCAACVQLE